MKPKFTLIPNYKKETYPTYDGVKSWKWNGDMMRIEWPNVEIRLTWVYTGDWTMTYMVRDCGTYYEFADGYRYHRIDKASITVGGEADAKL